MILQLQSGLLLIFAHGMGHDARGWRYIVVLYGARGGFKLTHDGRFLFSWLIIRIILLQLICRCES